MSSSASVAEQVSTKELWRGVRRSGAARLILAAYKHQFGACRSACYRLSLKLEGGEFYSETAREILLRFWGVRVGAYSYGECMVPGSFPAHVSVGRYVSIGPDVRVFLRNHPTDRLSMHPFFYNSALGFLERDAVGLGSLAIGHDSWIGARAIITPRCRRIGIGAVVGAGSVVTRDVPDFYVVAGNPAKVIRRRFDESICGLILESRWWEKEAAECAAFMREMTQPLGTTPSSHPLLARSGHAEEGRADECSCA